MTDIILIACLLLIAALGWKSGAINMLGSLGSWIVGYLCARSFSSALALIITERFPSIAPAIEKSSTSQFISMFIDLDVAANRIVQILCFIVLFIVVAFLVRKLCKLISKLFDGTLLGLLNSGLGAALGLFLGILLLGIVVEIALPALSSFDWSITAMEFFAKSEFVMQTVHEIIDLFVANMPQIPAGILKF